MRSHRLLAAVALVAASAVPLAAQVVPAASELGSLPVTGQQHSPTISMNAGGALVAWDHDTLGIVARRLSPAYAQVGGQIVLAASDATPPVPFYHVALHVERDPSVALRGDGAFVAAWLDKTYDATADIFYAQYDLIASRVVARVFNADGTPASRLFVLSDAAVVASAPQAVVAGNGWFVAWQERNGPNSSVHMTTVTRGGAGDDIVVAAHASRPALAVGGNLLLVAYEKCCGAGGNAQIFAQQFSLSGNTAGGAFRVAAEGARGARGPAVAGQPTGDFMVTYQRSQPTNAYETRVYGQLVDRRGSLVGGEVRLSTGAGDAESAAVVAPLANGGWMVAWNTWEHSFPVEITGAAYSRLGNLTGQPFAMNDMPIARVDLALAAGPQGRLLAAWEGFDLTGARGLRARAAQGPRQ